MSQDASRPWRQLHRGIVDSNKLAGVSDGAFRLYIYLIALQDDDGKYPWTEMDRRRIAIGTEWDDSAMRAHVSALAQARLINACASHLEIVDGVKLNGRPSNARKHQSYDVPELENDVDSAMRAHAGALLSTEVQVQEEVQEERKERQQPQHAPVPTRAQGPANPPLNPLVAAMTKAYERLGLISPGIGELIVGWCGDHPETPVEWPDMAAAESEKANARSWRYFVKILDTWTAQGFAGRRDGRNDKPGYGRIPPKPGDLSIAANA